MDNSRIKYRLDLDPSDFMRRAREAQAALNALKAEASGVIYPHRQGGKEPENSPFPAVSTKTANYILPIPRSIQLPADPGFSKKLGYILPPPPRSGIAPPNLSGLEQGELKQPRTYVQTGASALTGNTPAEKPREIGPRGTIYPEIREGKVHNAPFPAVSAGKVDYVLPIPRSIPLPADPGFSNKRMYRHILPPPPRSGIAPPNLSGLEQGGLKQLPAHVQTGASALTDNIPAEKLREFGAEAHAASRGVTALRESLSKLRVVNVLDSGSIPKWITPRSPVVVPYAKGGWNTIPSVYTSPYGNQSAMGVDAVPSAMGWIGARGLLPPQIYGISHRTPPPPPRPKPAEVSKSVGIASSIKYAAGEVAGSTGWMGIGTDNSGKAFHTEVRVPGQKIPFYRDRPTASRPSNATEFKKNYSNVYPVSSLDAFRGEIAPASLSINDARLINSRWTGRFRGTPTIADSARGLAGRAGSAISSVPSRVAAGMVAQRTMPNLLSLKTMVGAYGLAKLTGEISDAGERMEYLRRMYEVFYGSAERGAKELEKTLLVARITPFDAIEIADQRRLLRAFGIDSERILMNIANTAAATDKPLQQITIALGRLASGVYGEGFEGLRRIGISQRELFAEGLEFNPRSQQFMGTPEQAINAVMRIMERRFPDMAASMMSTWKGQKENLHDAWVQAISGIGESMHEALIGPMMALSDMLIELRDGFRLSSNAAYSFADNIASLMSDPASFRPDSITGRDAIYDALSEDPGARATELRTQLDMNQETNKFSENLLLRPLLHLQLASHDLWGGVKGKTAWANEMLFGSQDWRKANEKEFQARVKEFEKFAETFSDKDIQEKLDSKTLFMDPKEYVTAIKNVHERRKKFKADAEAILPELEKREVAQFNQQLEAAKADKAEGRRGLIARDKQRLAALNAEIDRRERNAIEEARGRYLAIVEQTPRELPGSGASWHYDASVKYNKEVSDIKKQNEDLKRYRDAVQARLNSPTEYNRFQRLQAEAERKRNIQSDDDQSLKYSNNRGVSMNTQQNNYTYIYGQPGGTLTGAAGAYGGAR